MIDKPQARVIDLEDGGQLLFFEQWLGAAEQQGLFEVLSAGVRWRQEKIRMFGKELLQPRLTAAFADPGVRYRYSGLVVEPTPWPPELLDLKHRAERDADHVFNYALGNLYRQGGDSMGFHADDEAELGKNPVIASISLGAPRRFVLKHRRLSLPRVELELTGGSLLIMAGTTQHHWHHGVPRSKRPVGPRLNLTLRRVLTRRSTS